MNKTELQEGLGELADIAERDHEVQMARADLYKIAKYAIKLHEMLKGVSEAEGLEGWVQSKITKSADYLGSVYHHLDYDQVNADAGDEVAEGKFKSAAHRKAVHAGKASGRRTKKKLRAGAYESEYKDQLHARLAEKKVAEKVTTKKITAKPIQSKSISPNTGGNKV
jgi:hypothetical protein